MSSTITKLSDNKAKFQKKLLTDLSVEQTALLVLGMHRSGTSAVTRVLSLLGADLPENLMLPKAGNNEAGFWESQDTYRLNDRILNSAGSSWDDWRRFNPEWTKSPAAESFRHEAAEILQREFSHSSFFVLKDPRICRLMPFWLETFQSLGIGVKCVLPLRNPLEVAASLKRRDGFSAAKSYMLWLRHVLDAERDSRQLSRVFITYDNLMLDWSEAITRITEHLELSWPRKAAAAEHEIEKFLDDSHRHHAVDDGRLDNRVDIAVWVRDTAKALAKLVEDPYAKKPMRRLDGVRSEFNRASDALGAVLFAEEKARTAALEQAQGSQAEKSALESQLKESTSRLNGLEERATGQSKEISRLTDVIAKQEKHVSELQTAFDDKNREAAELSSLIAEKERLISELEGRMSSESRRVNELREEADARTTEVQTLRKTLALHEGREDELRKLAAERETKLEQLETERSTATVESAELKVELKHYEKALAQSESALTEATQRLRQLDDELTVKREALLEAQEINARLQASIENLESKLHAQQAEASELNIELESKASALAQSERDLTGAREQLAELQGELVVRSEAVKDAQELAAREKENVERLVRELEQSQGALAESSSLAEDRARVLEEKGKELKALQAEVQLRNKDNDRLRVQSEDRRAEIERLSSQVREAEQHAGALAESIVEKDRQVDRLQSDLEEKFNRVGELRALLKSADDAIRQAREVAEQREGRLSEREEVLAKRDQTIADLHDEVTGLRSELSLSKSSATEQLKGLRDTKAIMLKLLHRLHELNPGQGFVAKHFSAPPRRCCGIDLTIGDQIRYRRQAKLLTRQRLFDADWYIRRYPRVTLDGHEPLWHWLVTGWKKGFDPNPLFDVKWYLKKYPDVAASGINPLMHYLDHGAGEGRDPSRFFSTRWYLSEYPDVAAQNLNPLVHYLRHGAREKRNPNALFDAEWYLSHAPDAAHQHSCPLVHYLDEWKYQRVDPSPLFDSEYYLSTNPDVQRAGLNPWVHYLQHGMREGRNPNAYFDQRWYLQTYPDVARGEVPPLLHYLQHGAAEGRNPGPGFDTAWYLRQNPDVAKAGLNPLAHFLAFGRYEGRSPASGADRKGGANAPQSPQVADEPVSLSPAVRALQVTSEMINSAHRAIANAERGVFSIILPTWNREATITRSIDSILAQSYESWELLVCDDGSEDATESLVQSQYAGLLSSGKIRYLKLPHKGVSAARNAGLRAARGDWIAYLDSDNSWNPHYLLITAASFAENPERRTAYGGLHVRDEAGQREFVRAQEFDWGRVLKQNFIDLNIFAHHRIIYDQLGGFDESLTRLVDWDLIARYTRLYEPVFNKVILANYYVARSLNNITLTQPLQKNETAVRRKYASDVARFGATPLRLAYVLWDWPALSQTFVLEEIRELIGRGVDVRVYYVTSPDRPAENVPDVVATAVSDADELATLLQNDERNWIHSHFAYPAVTRLVWPAAEEAGIAFSFMPHAVDIFHHANRERNRIGEVTQSRYCARVMVHGSFHRKYLVDQGVPEEKITMTPQAVVTEAIRAETVSIRQRAQDDAFRILVIARFIEKKGVEDLIEAVNLLPRGRVAVRIVGYGPLEERYREIIQTHGLGQTIAVEESFEGLDALRGLLDWADLLCLPCVEAENGDMDGMPTVFFEAMAAGVPCLSGAVSAIPDFIVDGINGFLAPPRDPEGLAQRIDLIASMSPEALRAVAATARDYVDSEIGSRHTVDVLTDNCAQPPLDIFMVTYHRDQYGDWKATERAVASVLENTTTPFVLTIVDNGSEQPVVEKLREVARGDQRVRLIELGDNRFCGPASNIALSLARSEFVIYVCSNEGYVAQPGWERSCIRFMRNQPEVAMAGHLVSSPAWPDASGYMKQSWFQHFRNREFAEQEPGRALSHVQGGIWILRRSVFDQEGGFNPALPQGQMDVEYCYYLESLGYKLADVPGLIVLSNKTRPGIDAFLDERVLAVHPVFEEDLDLVRVCATGKEARCNVCGWHGRVPRAADGVGFECPECSSHPRERALYRWLAGSDLHHRGKSLAVAGLSDAVVTKLDGMFELVEANADIEVPEVIPGLPSRMLGISPIALQDADYSLDGDVAEAAQAPVCNICGGSSFGAGPGGRLSADTALPPRCEGCQSLERHRAFRAAMDMLKAEDWRQKRVLQFSQDRAVDSSWFDIHDVSVYGGSNSLDLQAIDRPDESYDIVICNHVMEHVANDELALQELYRVVDPEGFIFLSFPDPYRRATTRDWGYPDNSQHGHYRVYGRDVFDLMLSVLPGAIIYKAVAVDPVTGTREMFFILGKSAERMKNFAARLEDSQPLTPVAKTA